ncbi:MAG: RNA polymerase factor sigma-54, partial [Oscillospiraceae bacterium]|nr:RNA polymerase factor sigma-54 [Oscillospiraceae bacterium]
LLAFDQDYMSDVTDEEAAAFLKQKRLEAVNLIGSLDMRHSALELLVSYLAVEQRAFFTDGTAALQPLTQKKAAEDLGMHPSTVCRCVRDKYIGTPWGCFPLSDFFSVGLGEDGCSAAQARSVISTLIAQEDKAAPLSDLAVAELLEGKGIRISRRTVAKYRAQLGLGGQLERIRYV